MSIYLPAKARDFIVDGDTLASVQALTTAISNGQLELEALKTYVDATAKGLPIEYRATKPVSMLMLERIRDNPNEEPRRIVYQGLNDGHWTWEDVENWENNASKLSNARKSSVVRGVYLTRGRRVRARLPNVSNQFVPKMAMDVVCHHDLPDGAKACLAVLLALAGKNTEIVTFTSSIAKMMGRTPRTVRNYFIALEQCGLIIRTSGAEPNTVKIRILDVVKPEPYQEPKDIAAFKLARRSSDPTLREMAREIVSTAWSMNAVFSDRKGGRKEISAFNPPLNQIEETAVVRTLGPTTYSTFQPSVKTNRTDWRNRQQRAMGQAGRETPGITREPAMNELRSDRCRIGVNPTPIPNA